jgi:hypothetical protein
MTTLKKAKWTALLAVAGAALCGTASAGSMTWTDYYDFNPDRLLTQGQEVKFTHDITDGPSGFNEATDNVSWYSLAFDLYDDRDSLFDGTLGLEIGGAGDGALGAYFTLGGAELGLPTVNGFYQLNNSGLLSVTITSLLGDFYLGSSTLTATGSRNTSVPEPGTLALLGAALVGFGLVRRKRASI